MLIACLLGLERDALGVSACNGLGLCSGYGGILRWPFGGTESCSARAEGGFGRRSPIHLVI